MINKTTAHIVVLNDGETWAGVSGCEIRLASSDRQFDGDADDFETLRRWCIVVANGTPRLVEVREGGRHA